MEIVPNLPRNSKGPVKLGNSNIWAEVKLFFFFFVYAVLRNNLPRN